MRILPVVLAAVLVGAGLGTALALMSVGPVVGDPLAREPLPKSPEEQASLPEAAPAVGPRAEFEEIVHNFGTMQRGATRSHTFKVVNTGTEPLVLVTGETSCKCTSFTAGDGPLAPGATGKIVLEWAAKVTAGPFRQTAKLTTNDPGNYEVVFSVEGEIVDAAGLVPQEFGLGRVTAGEPSSASVVFMSFESPDLEVTATMKRPPSGDEVDPAEARDEGAAVEQGDPPFELVVTPIDPDDFPDKRAKAASRITLTTDGNLPIGSVMEWVLLKTNIASQPQLQLPVLGRVEGDVAIRGPLWSPDTGVLALGMVDATVGKSVKLRVSVKGSAAADAELRVASVDPPELEVTLGEPRVVRDDFRLVPLTVAVPIGTRPMVRLNNARLPDGTFQHPEGEIRLTSGLSSTPEIKLRVRFAVERGGR